MMHRWIHLNTARRRGDVGFVEHPEGWYDTRNSGERRLNAHSAPGYETGEGFAALPLTGNLGYADRWIYLLGGQFGDGTAALWNQAAGTIDHGNTADPLAGDGFGPDVMMYAAPKAGGGVYQLWSDGAPRLWSGEASAPAPSGTSANWHLRTATPDRVSYFDGTTTYWGAGNLAGLGSPIALRHWGITPTAYAPFFGPIASVANGGLGTGTLDPDPSRDDPPAFGPLWSGHLAAVFNLNGWWVGYGVGFIVDEGLQPIGVPVSGSADFFIPANAILLTDNANPLSASGWNQCLRVLANYDLDNSYTNFGPSLPAPADNPFTWIEKIQIGGQDYAFFSNNPYFVYNHDSLHPNDNAVLYMTRDHDTGAATIHASYLYSDDHTSIVGPVANGNDLYLCELNTGAQKLKLLKMTSPPDGWDVLASYDYTGAGLGGIGIVNGYLHVALGWLFTRSSSAHISPAPSNGQDILSYKLDDGPFVLMDRAFFPDGYSAPIVTPAKFFAADNIGYGFIGGGGGGGTGPCDDVFSAFGASSISATALQAHLDSHGTGGFLSEHTGAEWRAIVAGTGINPAFWLAQAHHEEGCFTDHGILPAAAKNPMAFKYGVGTGYIVGDPQPTIYGNFNKYASLEAAVTAYCALINTKAGWSISQIITWYAPPGVDGNNTTAYIDAVCSLMDTWQAEG